jgi:hypothetical protein
MCVAGIEVSLDRVESLFKKTQDCADYSEAGGRPYWTPTKNQSWIRQNICNLALHERLSPVE